MIIDKEQLIRLLEEKTGHEREKVEGQLEELVKRIQQAAEENKTFEIEGFGTFSMEDDNLRFEPSDMLETEINNKYAGMKPIELIGAFKEPDGGDIPTINIDENIDDTPDRSWSFDEGSTVEEEPSEQPVAASDEESPGDEVEDEQSEKSEEPVVPEEVAEEIFDMTDSEGIQDQPSLSPELSAEEAAELEEDSSEPVVVEDQEKEKDMMSQFLIAAVVVIAVGLSGWVAYDTGLLGAEENTTENTRQASQISAQQSEILQEESSQESSSQASEDNNSSEPEEELAVGKQEDLQKNEAEEESTFGLKGDVNETISGGYTIVVHSLRSIKEAEDRKENLQESGYRALINKADVQGTTYYRVGLGQFENVDDALEAVSDIPESFQSSQNHFIKRIQ